MSFLTGLFHNLTDAAWIMQHGGLYIVLLIVFAETGLFGGFFLPGDSLLFITGMIIAGTPPSDSSPYTDLAYWISIISIAGIAGNLAGYWFGKKWGDILLAKRDNWIYKKRYITSARDFYEKNGGRAIIFARFLPVVRTFAPIVAGMVNMDKKLFARYNIIGSFAWVGSIVTIGFMLGEKVWVKENLESIIVGIIAITTLPVIIKLIYGNRSLIKNKKQIS